MSCQKKCGIIKHTELPLAEYYEKYHIRTDSLLGAAYISAGAMEIESAAEDGTNEDQLETDSRLAQELMVRCATEGKAAFLQCDNMCRVCKIDSPKSKS